VTIGLGLRTERATTDVIPTAATVENNQGADLGSQFGFACFDEELPKLVGECGERVGPSFKVLFFGWLSA